MADPTDTLRSIAVTRATATAFVASVRDVLAVASLCVLAHWVRPTASGVVVFVGCATVAGLGLRRWFSVLRAGRSSSVDPGLLGRVDNRLDMQDQLRTYGEVGLAEDSSGVRGWLGRAVGARLERVDVRSAARREAWPSFRSVRWLGAVLLLVLLVRWFAWFIPLPALGPLPMLASGGGAGAGAAAGGGGAEGDGRSGRGAEGEEESPGDEGSGPDEGAEAPDEEPGGAEPDEEPEDEPDPEPDAPPEETGGDPPVPDPADRDSPEGVDENARPPRDLLDLEIERDFLLPGFVDDGATIDAEASGVSAVERSGGDLDKPPPVVGPAGPAGPNETPPVESPETFVQARERAVRARHVPASERELVRRWFDVLLRGDGSAEPSVEAPQESSPGVKDR